MPSCPTWRTTSSAGVASAAPTAWADTLDHPPVALLRVPAVPPEAGAQSLVAQVHPAPALRWLPPDLPPPGPFDPERPWAPAAAYPFPADPGTGVQRGLFEDFDA